MSNTVLQDHPVKVALAHIEKSQSWLAKQARPDDPTSLIVRISEVFNGRRPQFSRRDGLAIYAALKNKVPRRMLTVEQVFADTESRAIAHHKGATHGQ